MLIIDAEGPWETLKGVIAGERAASGEREGEKLGDMATEEMDPSALRGDRLREAKWGNVLPTAGFGGTVLAPGWATEVMRGGGSILDSAFAL